MSYPVLCTDSGVSPWGFYSLKSLTCGLYITHLFFLLPILGTMKKPWSPSSSQDNVPCAVDFTCLHEGENEAELTPDDGEEKKEREKKHASFTLCSVCNIQLNSLAQAQIHYNGKSHQKRLKQLSNGNLKNEHGKLPCYILSSESYYTLSDLFVGIYLYGSEIMPQFLWSLWCFVLFA